MDDSDKIVEWQKTRDPKLFLELTQQFKPLVHKTVNQYRTTGISTPTLTARARSNFINALNTYNPDFNTQPITHIYNHLRKTQRQATESISSGRIPEHRNMKMATYMTVRTNLEDNLGREPSAAELADELGYSMKSLELLEKEIGGEVTASGADFPFYGNSVQFENKDLANAEYIYHSGLSDKERVVMEHTFGFGGKSILNNKEISAKLNTNEMAVSRMKKKLGEMLREAR